MACAQRSDMASDLWLCFSRLRWTEPADVAALQEQCDVILSADWSVARAL